MLRKKQKLTKRKIRRHTSKSASTGLNVNPFFTVSAVNSSWTKQRKT